MVGNTHIIYRINIKKSLRKLSPMQVNLINDYGMKIHVIERKRPDINIFFIK
jgi:hypothetical protein